ISLALLCLKDQRKKSELTAFTTVVRPHDEDDVLDADNDDERPQNERQHSEDICRIGHETVFFLEPFTDRVERACSYVAVHDANCEQRELRQTAASGMRIYMRAYWKP